MNKIMNSKFLMLLLFLIPLWGCEDEMDKHYKRPEWLEGSAYEVLAEKGNYSLFLQAVDKAGFNQLVSGQGLCTVFAPDDQALTEWLNNRGYGSLDAVPMDTLSTLVGYHIVEYSYRPQDLFDFQPNGVLNPSTTPGIYYKHKTYGKDPAWKVTLTDGTTREVYKQEKYLPVISTELFHAKKLTDLEYNYKYFYPGSQWKGDNQFYVSNACLLEGENGLPTDNGYLYLVNEVVNPLRNVYNVLEDPRYEYSTFKKLYDRFQDVTYSAKLTAKYADAGDSIYVYYHNSLPCIASEWTFNYEGGFEQNLTMACGIAFNAFVPSNAVLEQWLNDYFSAYESYSDIPIIQLYYLLINHVYSTNLLLPEEIRNGDKTTIFGDKYDFDVDQVKVREMCTNGVFYGIDKVLVPAPFKTVTSPVFKDPKYDIFLHLLSAAGEILQLTNPDVEYTLLLVEDKVFEANGIRLNVTDGNLIGGWKLQKMEVESGEYKDMASVDITNLASMHILPRKITDFSKQDIFPCKRNMTFLKVFGGGVAGEDETTEPISVARLGEFSNGVTYEIGQLLTKNEQTLIEALSNSKYSEFWSLVQKAGLSTEINGAISLPMLAGETVMLFIPTNEAIRTATNIPDDPEELADFLRYFFVTLESNKMSGYIFPGTAEIGDEGLVNTKLVDEENSNIYEKKYMKMGIYRDTDSFSLRLTNNGSKETHTLPGVYPEFTSEGIIYQINTTDILPD